ncbi:COG4648 family protein [Methylovulum miyakonense]|uniref:COG4648 family protein n=1 Tax=Methylovulum miyakonense TaxID=645578 RepID=UPI0003744E05|nr:hypothetical protein [Methylovulum miyakonense]
MHMMINGLIGLLTMLYPFAVYFGTQYLEPWKIAAVLFVLLGIRLVASYSVRHWSCPLLIAGMVYCGFAIWSNALLTLRFYPAIANAAMLLLFSASLLSSQSLIERLARLQHPDLPPEGILYTRRVTWVWCGFFIVNGGIALATALWASIGLWSLYNGFIAYLLMGILLVGEYIIRMKTQKHVK